MKSVVRYISKFEKDAGIFIGVLKFKNEPPLDILQKIFNETGPMYDEYPITHEPAGKIGHYVDGELEAGSCDYFLSCDEDVQTLETL